MFEIQDQGKSYRWVVFVSLFVFSVCGLVALWVNLPVITNLLPGNVCVYSWMTNPRTKKQQVEKDFQSLISAYIALRMSGIAPVDNSDWCHILRRETMLDPWGNAYVYVSHGPVFISYGPDGVSATGDDIRSTPLSEDAVQQLGLKGVSDERTGH